MKIKHQKNKNHHYILRQAYRETVKQIMLIIDHL